MIFNSLDPSANEQWTYQIDIRALYISVNSASYKVGDAILALRRSHCKDVSFLCYSETCIEINKRCYVPTYYSSITTAFPRRGNHNKQVSILSDTTTKSARINQRNITGTWNVLREHLVGLSIRLPSRINWKPPCVATECA